MACEPEQKDLEETAKEIEELTKSVQEVTEQVAQARREFDACWDGGASGASCDEEWETFEAARRLLSIEGDRLKDALNRNAEALGRMLKCLSDLHKPIA